MEAKVRPDPRDKVISARVPVKVHERMHLKAEDEGRSSSSVLRSFAFNWVNGELPTPVEQPGDGLRAKRRTR